MILSLVSIGGPVALTDGVGAFAEFVDDEKTALGTIAQPVDECVRQESGPIREH